MWGKKKKVPKYQLDEDGNPLLDEYGQKIPVENNNRDKIFGNTYGEQDITQSKVNFRLSPTYGDSMDPDDKMHYDLLFKN